MISFIIFIIYYILCPLFHIRSSLNISTEYRYIIQIQTGSHPGILPSDLREIYSSSHHKIITCSTGKFSFWNIIVVISTCWQVFFKLFCVLYPKYIEATLRFLSKWFLWIMVSFSEILKSTRICNFSGLRGRWRTRENISGFTRALIANEIL